MKTILRQFPGQMGALTAVAALALALAPPAFAGDKHGDGKRGKASHFETLDTNGDGKLTPEEHSAGAQQMFAMMDADKDGKVTAAEMDGAKEQVTGRRQMSGDLSAAEKIKKVDSNGDGVLTADEHTAGAKAIFTQMDKDGDGALTKKELKAGHHKHLRKAVQRD